jgi:hypothetical protein
MVNGPAGDTLVSGTWNQNQAIIRSFSTIIDTACTPGNCKFTVMVYRDSANALYFSEVAQAIQNTVLGGDPTDVGTREAVMPTASALEQNYPNPFNPVTHINYSVAQTGNVTLKLFDVMGREVATLVNEEKAPGTYTVPFDASSFSSGVYFYRLKAGAYTSTKKLILAK